MLKVSTLVFSLVSAYNKSNYHLSVLHLMGFVSLTERIPVTLYCNVILVIM